MSEFFLVKSRQLWGDYGDTLINGYNRRNSLTGRLEIKRAGPFVPPFCFSSIMESAMLVADNFKAAFVREFPEATLFPTSYYHLNCIPWQTWENLDQCPRELMPEEPDCFLERPHEPALAERMEPQWDVELTQSDWQVNWSWMDVLDQGWREFGQTMMNPAGFQTLSNDPAFHNLAQAFFDNRHDFQIRRSKTPMNGLFLSTNGVLLASASAQERLARVFGEWISFQTPQSIVVDNTHH